VPGRVQGRGGGRGVFSLGRDRDLARGARVDARRQFILACSSGAAGDLCARAGDLLAPDDPDWALRFYDDACRSASSPEAHLRSCLAAGDLDVEHGNLVGAEKVLSIACEQVKKGSACDRLQRLRAAQAALMQPVDLDTKIAGSDESTWTVELDKAAHLSVDADAWLAEQVTAPAGATLSATLGRHGAWLHFSAGTITKIDGTKVMLRKRATVPFVIVTRTGANGAKETNDVPLGRVGARVHLRTQRATTVAVADIAAWWKRTGPLPALP
jgi:hypothetical protein